MNYKFIWNTYMENNGFIIHCLNRFTSEQFTLNTYSKKNLHRQKK